MLPALPAAIRIRKKQPGRNLHAFTTRSLLQSCGWNLSCYPRLALPPVGRLSAGVACDPRTHCISLNLRTLCSFISYFIIFYSSISHCFFIRFHFFDFLLLFISSFFSSNFSPFFFPSSFTFYTFFYLPLFSFSVTLLFLSFPLTKLSSFSLPLFSSFPLSTIFPLLPLYSVI